MPSWPDRFSFEELSQNDHKLARQVTFFFSQNFFRLVGLLWYPTEPEGPMTRAVSVGRSFNGLWAAGALGLAFFTISWAGCAGSLDPGFTTGGAGSSGAAGSATGMAGTTGMAGGTGIGGMPGGVDIAMLVTKYTCAAATICHDASGAGANFNMAAADWQSHLVDVKPKGGGAIASVCAKDSAYMNLAYIKKGDPNGDGLFLQKLQGPICAPGGVQMPLTGGPVTAADLMLFKQWATALANQ
ncbi:MAG TPA: hypothetical protein VGK52_12295 [Polyangia bacterium]